MESTSGPHTGKGPGARLILAAVLMVLGSLITGFIVILAMMSRLATVYDRAVGFITAVLLLLEISFALAVLLVRLRRLPYKPKKMRALTVLMLIVNCGLVLWCVIIDLYYVNWASRQYIPLAFVLLRTVLVPGVLVKLFALMTASDLIPKESSDDEHEEGIFKFIIIAIITAGMLLTGSGIIYYSLVRERVSKKTAKYESDHEPRAGTTMKIETYNTDLIDGSSTILIVDSGTVVVTYLEVFPDGRIDDDEIDLYADEDYRTVLKYNGESRVTDFHIGEPCEYGYIMKIDYETGAVDVSQNENTG